MLFVQNDKKEAFKSCFSDVRTWIQEASQKRHSARSREAESQNPSDEDSWIFEVENPFFKNQSMERIQTEVS